MEFKKEIEVKDYFEIHDFYSRIYGDERTIICMQVGSFYEFYSTETKGPNLQKICEQLNIVFTKKDNKNMAGFPLYCIDNYIDKLLNLNYTIIKIEQTTPAPHPKREITSIISPGTNIESNLSTEKTNLVSIVIDKIKSKNGYLLYFGIASYNLSSGYGSFYETVSNDYDQMKGLDNIVRYLENNQAKEVLLYNLLDDNEEINNMKLNDILVYFGFDEKIIFNYKNFSNKNNTKISFQKLLFDEIYKNKLNVFEYLNLHLYNNARLALFNLLEYVKNHQKFLIEALKKPIEFQENEYLYLGNHALEQLDVISNNNKNLFKIINYTKTLMGKRFLYNALTKPLIKKEYIDERLNAIEEMKNKNINLNNLLEDVNDLDKINRKLELNIMHPYELNQLYLSFYQINKIYQYLSENNLVNVFKIEPKYNTITKLLNYIENIFDLNIINDLNFNNYTTTDISFIKPLIYKEIDELQEKINKESNFMDNLIIELDKLIDDKKIFVKKTETNNKMLSLQYNDRDGHYLLITTRRCEILKKKLETIKEIKIGNIKLKKEDLEMTALPKSSNTKIICITMKNISNELIIDKTEMARLLKQKFKEQLNYISENYIELLNYWSLKIAYIDFINSGVICSIKNHYTKPNIILSNESHFKMIELRHPIIENLNQETEYKTHNLDLGGNNKITGVILYGINSSGKSTLMKAVGLNIILAQIGYYTACKSLELAPYKSLMTRINSNDNLFKNLSSFMLEMMEITSILKRNNCNTIVLGDELCRGTEEKSSNIIIAYLIKKLSETKTTLITTSHLHNLITMTTIKELINKTIQIKHLKITYDIENDKLIYDRELLDGMGESYYGLTVAKFLMKDNYFNEETSKILLDYNATIKSSKYNKDSYLDKCNICSITDNLETHHIKFQKDFMNDIYKDDIHIIKDKNYNLITLCSKCHDNVDRNKIIINGWIETSDKRELDY